jgi:hypothetical protein
MLQMSSCHCFDLLLGFICCIMLARFCNVFWVLYFSCWVCTASMYRTPSCFLRLHLCVCISCLSMCLLLCLSVYAWGYDCFQC